MLEAFQSPAVTPAPSKTQAVCSLALAHNAHKVLLQQALLLRGRLGCGIVPLCNASPHTLSADRAPTAEAAEHTAVQGSDTSSASTACQRPGSAAHSSNRPGSKAQELMRFLQSHVQRMQSLLLSLHGASISQLDTQPQLQQPPGPQLPQGPSQPSQCCKPSCCNSQQCRPCTAWVQPQITRSAGTEGSVPALATAAGNASLLPTRPSSAAASTQQEARVPDLTPYLRFPPRRPASASAYPAHRQRQTAMCKAGSSADAEVAVQQLQSELISAEPALLAVAATAAPSPATGAASCSGAAEHSAAAAGCFTNGCVHPAGASPGGRASQATAAISA